MGRRRGRMGQTSVDRDCHRLLSSSHGTLRSCAKLAGLAVAGLFTLKRPLYNFTESSLPSSSKSSMENTCTLTSATRCCPLPL